MEIFVERFQKERYEKWLAGEDIGPDPKDSNLVCAAPSPFIEPFVPNNKP